MTDLALKALMLHDAWMATPQDRGGANGPKGRAHQAFLDAKAAALGNPQVTSIEAASETLYGIGKRLGWWKSLGLADRDTYKTPDDPIAQNAFEALAESILAAGGVPVHGATAHEIVAQIIQKGLSGPQLRDADLKAAHQRDVEVTAEAILGALAPAGFSPFIGSGLRGPEHIQDMILGGLYDHPHKVAPRAVIDAVKMISDDIWLAVLALRGSDEKGEPTVTPEMIRAAWAATDQAMIFEGEETRPGWRILDGEVNMERVLRAALNPKAALPPVNDTPEHGKPLSTRSSRLLRPGDILVVSAQGIAGEPDLLLPKGALVEFVAAEHGLVGVRSVDQDQPEHDFWGPHCFAFVGRPDEDGWMPKVLETHPARGVKLDVRYFDGAVVCGADNAIWSGFGQGCVMAFRLSRKAAPTPMGGDREHSSRCWGRTSFSDEVLHCYCQTAPTPMGGEVEALREALMAAQSFIADGGLAESEPGASIYRQITQALAASSPSPAQGGTATWHPLDDNGMAEVRINGKRITTMPSYPGAEEVAQRINAALSASPQPEAGEASEDDRAQAWLLRHYRQKAEQAGFGSLAEMMHAAAPPSVQPVEGK